MDIAIVGSDKRACVKDADGMIRRVVDLPRWAHEW